MHDVRIRMKDGRKFTGPLWSFRPTEGWFSIVSSEPNLPERIYFRDVEEAVNRGQRVSVARANVDVDLIERARREGWDGQ